MSVAAMTMDDQRPLINSYDKMSSKQYEQSYSAAGVSGVGGGVGGGSGGINSITAPPSGPASPTPSGSEEPPTAQQQQHNQYQHSSPSLSSSHHHHHHHHSHHNQHALHQQQHHHQQQPTVAPAAAAVAAEQRQRLLEDEIESLKLEQTRLSQQCTDVQRREKILMRRLANKEQEFQDYVSQIAEYKAAQAPSAIALRSALLDPAVNLLFEKLKKELKATKAKLEETQNELSAWKFTPDSNTGKRLMAKCRLLYQENEELGKMTSNGRLAKLETELAMQKSFSEEVKKSQSELDDFLQELDEDVEGMQSTILFLQQELKTSRERIQLLEKDNYQLKNGGGSVVVVAAAAATTGPIKNGDNAHVGPMNGNHTISNELTDGPTYHHNSAMQQQQQQQPPIIISPASNAIISSSSSTNLTINEMKFQATTPTPIANATTATLTTITTIPPATTLTPTTTTTIPITTATNPLQTIDENECLRPHPPAIYFNGIGGGSGVGGVGLGLADTIDGQHPRVVVTHQMVNAGINVGIINATDDSNSAKLRTLASRKRNYVDGVVDPLDVTTNTNVTIATQPPTVTPPHVASPRTLPPKKSKLRIMPVRRASQQSIELNDAVDCYGQPIVGNIGVGVPIAGVGIGGIVEPMDNAVAGIANDESGVLIIDESVDTSTPETGAVHGIVTRRRSVRNQNGGGGSSSGASNSGSNDIP